MAKYRAIPDGYMTVGEVAKKMRTTVRTLQYYDKEGLLSPSAESEGGRRLYTDKDLVTLNQIISLKSLGFSLDDIKERLISLETPADVANALTEQADDIRQKIEQLQIENIPPESEKCQKVIKEYWGLIMEFTDGDMSMLPKLMKVGNIDTATNAWEERQKIVNDYVGPALQVYFSRLGINPFEEEKQ